MFPASIRFALCASLLTTAAGCAAFGVPCAGGCRYDAYCRAPSGALAAACHPVAGHQHTWAYASTLRPRCGRCGPAWIGGVVHNQHPGRPAAAVDRWHVQSSDHRQPTEPVRTSHSARPPSGITQASYELPYGMETTSFQQPAEVDAPELADPQFAPPTHDPFETVPDESEAAPAPMEVVPEAMLEPFTVYNEPVCHQACCRPRRVKKSIGDRFIDAYAGFGPKGGKVRRLRHWLWDQTYRFRIRNAEQSRALHHESFYEPVRPTSLPNYGHYQTLWRRFEDDTAFCPPPEFGLSPVAYPSGDGWEVQSPLNAGPADAGTNATPLPPQPEPAVE